MKKTNPSMTQHLIFGAGLIGGFMAASFSAKGLRVSVLGREKYRQRFSADLLATDYAGQRMVGNGIVFFSDPKQVEDRLFDFIWLTVKSTGLEQALKEVAPLVAPQTILISCQNGLGSEQRLKQAFPKHRVLRAIMQSNVADLGMTHLHRGSQGRFEVEEYLIGDQSLAELINTPVLPSASVLDVQAYAWAKLQLNLGNAVNALANVPVREMLANRGYRKIIASAMRELLLVADHKHIQLPKISAVPMKLMPSILSLPNFLFEIVGQSMLKVDPTVRTSMWWDLHNKRLTEIDYLNGAVVDAAISAGIACPMNQRIVELVHQMEENEQHTALPAKEFYQ